MDSVKVTVIIVTYNTDIKKIFNTIDSVLLQKNVDCSIIIADDGSKNLHKEEILKHFQEISFLNYEFTQNKINQGTVINILNGLKKVKTEYVYVIGPGDYFYSNEIIYDITTIAMENNADVICGNAVNFIRLNNSNLVTESVSIPYEKEAFLKKNNLKKRLIIYRDRPHGAAQLHKTKSYIDILEQMKNKVVYCEDLSLELGVIKGWNIIYLDKNVILYEYGSGISTSKKNIWCQRMEKDEIAMNHLLLGQMQLLGYSNKELDKVACVNKLLLEKSKIKRIPIYIRVPELFLYNQKRKFIKRKGSMSAPNENENPIFYE